MDDVLLTAVLRRLPLLFGSTLEFLLDLLLAERSIPQPVLNLFHIGDIDVQRVAVDLVHDVLDIRCQGDLEDGYLPAVHDLPQFLHLRAVVMIVRGEDKCDELVPVVPG